MPLAAHVPLERSRTIEPILSRPCPPWFGAYDLPAFSFQHLADRPIKQFAVGGRDAQAKRVEMPWYDAPADLQARGADEVAAKLASIVLDGPGIHGTLAPVCRRLCRHRERIRAIALFPTQHAPVQI
jgi:hypothetical protein